jgi:hypothetical protein
VLYTYITGELEEETSVCFRRPSIDPREERMIDRYLIRKKMINKAEFYKPATTMKVILS